MYRCLFLFELTAISFQLKSRFFTYLEKFHCLVTSHHIPTWQRLTGSTEQHLSLEGHEHSCFLQCQHLPLFHQPFDLSTPSFWPYMYRRHSHRDSCSRVSDRIRDYLGIPMPPYPGFCAKVPHFLPPSEPGVPYS